ncbi:MAG: ATP-binding protein [Gammaproteobacteria bacterium]|nr:ATP-binding protein [Gammaproteobacteria bacterium]
MIKRLLGKIILERFHRGKLILVLGPRQAGKTTLMRWVVEQSGLSALWLNGDEPDVRELLSNTTSTRLKTLLGGHRLAVIDEAQRIPNIGLSLKLMADNLQNTQILVTGSSALELANKINEPLTGRKYEYFLFPLSYAELAAHTSPLEERRLLEHRLIYGCYPEPVTWPGEEKERLHQLADSYLYKDIFTHEQIKKPAVLEKLLQALALQIGSEVNYHELGQLAGADRQTVERYIDLLEKSFVVFRLPSLNRNMRNEIKKGRKIYFYDNGIRNSIIKNFNPLNLRQDTGALWENFLVNERIKANHYAGRWVNRYFWRTHAQQEIDYIEECDGKLYAFEFKWNPKAKARFPKNFIRAYPQSETMAVTTGNFEAFFEHGGLAEE